MIIVDSSVWVDWLRDIHTAQTEVLCTTRAADIAVTDIILCEILQGASEHTVATVTRQMQRFPIFNIGGVEHAVAAAANYRFLRSKGYTVRKLADCLIATFCIENNHALLHRDRDFDPFEQHLGLRVIPPQRQTVK